MPYGDGTGPLGQGPLTGGGFGRCGAGQSGYGRGQGRGLGAGGLGAGGPGAGNGFCARLGRGLRRAFGFGLGGTARPGGFFRFGRFPRTTAPADRDPSQDRIEALEREIADLKEQLRSR